MPPCAFSTHLADFRTWRALGSAWTSGWCPMLLAVKTILLISIGAIVGANARYFIGQTFGGSNDLDAFPWSTFVINVSGSLILGAFLALALRIDDPAPWRLAIAVGFCGSFTTFSTFSSESFALLRDGRVMLVAAYSAASVVAGIATLAAAYNAVERLTR